MAGPDPSPSKQNPEVHACARAEADPFDDMHDSQSDWDRYSSLLPLDWCCVIAQEFDDADQEAVRLQKWHRGFIYIAAFAGTIAVVMAIVGLGYAAAAEIQRQLHPEEAFHELAWEATLEWVELAVALIAVAIVGIGFMLKFKENWLRLRHRAELYRLLRYNFLIQPAVWLEGNPEAWIKERLAEIRRLTEEADFEKALNEPSPPGPYAATLTCMEKQRLQALTQYYLGKRLGPQKEYLANRAQRNEIKDWMRRFLPFFFFGSIVAVVGKQFVREPHHWLGVDRPHPWTALSLVMAATLLPVLAAGIRTYLAAFEFSRNKGRFYAAHKALSDTEKSLVQNTFVAVTAGSETQRQESLVWGTNLGQVIVVAEQAASEHAGSAEIMVDSYPVLRDLAWCEHVLDAEHREWLRLMFDAEWFG